MIQAEAIYTVQDVAAYLKLSETRVREEFAEMPGVMVVPSRPKHAGTRPRQTLRIPGSAVLALQQRWTRAGFGAEVAKGRRSR